MSITRTILPAPVVVSEQEALSFYNAIAHALASGTFEQIQNAHLVENSTVIISYSKYYEPFISLRKGFTDKSERLYIRTESNILNRVAEALEQQGRDIPGGRVFITQQYAFIKDENSTRHVILSLNWKNQQPYKDIRFMRDYLLQSS